VAPSLSQQSSSRAVFDYRDEWNVFFNTYMQPALRFTAPELVEGSLAGGGTSRTVSGAADVFSLGARPPVWLAIASLRFCHWVRARPCG
jgi:hypothetical protein